MDALLAEWSERVRAAAAQGDPLCIRGGGSKDFYGNASAGTRFDPRAWSGIESHEPSELVITVRAGTPLAEVEAHLAAHGQMLAFEPPHFGGGATMGGCVAAGLSGPRRTAAGHAHGSLRDALLGARLLDGRARLLRFGGTVIKNVAGYDVARVLAGSLGILGIIIDVSLKVLPLPAAEQTRCFDMDEARALRALAEWMARPLPISASCWRDGRLWLRLSGRASVVRHAGEALGGEPMNAGDATRFWQALRDQQLDWFADDGALWRVSLPSHAEPLGIDAPQLIEWGGALRWLRTALPAPRLRERARLLGGHATLFRGGERAAGAFTSLSAPLLAIHQRLKDEFDPARIFNRGRMYPGL